MLMSEIQLKTSLRDKTLELLRERPRTITFEKISNDTGLPIAWLASFARGRWENPQVNRVQTLYEYLAKRELEV